MVFDLAGGMTRDSHGVTGLLAILLMAVHAAWAAVVLLRWDASWTTGFHRFSIVVWVLWLVTGSLGEPERFGNASGTVLRLGSTRWGR